MRNKFKEIMRFILRPFLSTKECHAKLDDAVKKSEMARERATSLCEMIAADQVQHAVTNGANHG